MLSGRGKGRKDAETPLESARQACRGSLLWVAGFSLCLNVLLLTPALYMLQVYDRVITSGSEATLLMLPGDRHAGAGHAGRLSRPGPA